MNEDSNIEERYSICPGVYEADYGTYYNFVKLDEELFKSFMLGNIGIEEVLNKIDKKEFNKSLTKSIGNVDII